MIVYRMATSNERRSPERKDSLEGILVRLRSGILSGAYPVGFHLRESTLAAEMGVSRTPVREALQRLAVEGMVDLYPNRGARVAGWSEEELEEISGLRILLESYGARLAAGRVTEAGLQRLRELAQQMEDALNASRGPQHDRVAALNNEFHMMILGAAGNQRLSSILSSLVHLPLVHRTFLRYSPARLRQSMSHHRELIEALAQHDPDWAEAVMRSHLIAARSFLVSAGEEDAGDEAAGAGL